MRIALILLSIVALLFISSISWSLIRGSEAWIPQKVSQSSDTNGTDIEALRQQIKTEEKIKALEEKVAELSKKAWITDTNTSASTTWSLEVVPLSGKFLAQVLPTASLELTENTGIYGLYTFDKSFLYSSYLDTKLTLRAIAIDIDYDTFLKNAKALGKDVYTVNETKTFPVRSFYLNPPKSDTTVRLVLEYEKQTIALEISKTKFPTLKTLLLKK